MREQHWQASTMGITRKRSLEEAMRLALMKRKEAGTLRELSQSGNLIDFCSNDYLGFARSPFLIEKTLQAMRLNRIAAVGSTGSRLVSGNHAYYESVEQQLASHYKYPAALLFNSGYDLNLSVASAIPQPGDMVFFDELIHNSTREGLKLCRGRFEAFSHSDLNDLRSKIEAFKGQNVRSRRGDTGGEVARMDVHRDKDRVKSPATQGPNEGPSFKKSSKPSDGNIIVMVESIYSMDGDEAPLRDLCSLCAEFDCYLIVDEAHSVGVAGKGGRGLVHQLGLQEDVFATIYTFGKAMGCHGAVLCGSTLVKEYMINYARPLIYSTSLSWHALAAISASHEICVQAEEERTRLHTLIDLFRHLVKDQPSLRSFLLPSESAIQCILVPGNEQVLETARACKSSGFDVRPIRSPTVQQGTERLRIIMHSHNTEGEVRELVEVLSSTLSVLNKI